MLLSLPVLFSACGKNADISSRSEAHVVPTVSAQTADIEKISASPYPNLQKEVLDDRNKTTDDPIGTIDFRNFTYPFPRGWQDRDAREFTLENGVRPKTEEKIGMSYLTTKFLDATGDGTDEAFVVMKIETGGSAIPQIVYVFSMSDSGEPELIWHFRTGDRSDGGLKDIRAENGEIIVELYGQDRYILGEIETMKITGDEEQICCPTHFTRSNYKWNGTHFILQGKRLTFSTADKNEPPVENKGNLVSKN